MIKNITLTAESSSFLFYFPWQVKGFIKVKVMKVVWKFGLGRSPQLLTNVRNGYKYKGPQKCIWKIFSRAEKCFTEINVSKAKKFYKLKIHILHLFCESIFWMHWKCVIITIWDQFICYNVLNELLMWVINNAKWHVR